MIAVDTNLLVYAHRAENPFHATASRSIASLAESRLPWAIPWPCVHEFCAVVTNPRVFKTPTPIAGATMQVDMWLESPSLVLLGEAAGHWSTFRKLMAMGSVRAGMVHDARIAAICLDNDVRELWSADRDFNRFTTLTVRNPLLD
jgi:uncharacterized protein